MSELFDFDPVRGVRYDWEYDEMTGEATIQTSQDVSAAIDYAKALRASGKPQETLKRDDYFVLHAIIPPVVEMQLLKRGIDISRPEDHKRMMKVIEKEYPYLKTTDMHG